MLTHLSSMISSSHVKSKHGLNPGKMRLRELEDSHMSGNEIHSLLVFGKIRWLSSDIEIYLTKTS